MWEWILENETRLRYLCRLGCRGRYDLVDDLYHDVVLARMPNIWDQYDSERAAFWTYASKNLRFYIWKHMNRRARRATDDLENVEEPVEYFDLGSSLRVHDLLDGLDENEKRIIVCRFVYELTYKEIADLIGVSRPIASRMCNEAIDRLREINDA